MIKSLVLNEEVKDGKEYVVLDLAKTLTRPLEAIRQYLKRTDEQILQDGNTENMKDLLAIIESGMEERDKLVTRSNLAPWTKENLLDLLYELEYQRFLDIKKDTTGVFFKMMLPHLQNKEIKDDKRYIISYGDVGSVIDVKTLSIITYLYSSNGIIGDKIRVEDSDIAYFNSDLTKDGKSKVITPKQPIEVSENCIEQIIELVAGDNGTSNNRQMARALKYHRAKLVIANLTVNGEPLKAGDNLTIDHIKQLAMGFFKDRLTKDGNKYYMVFKDSDISQEVNAAVWELYYSSKTRSNGSIPHRILNEFPKNKLVLYSLGEAIDVTTISVDTNNVKKPNSEYGKKRIGEYSLCIGMVEENDLDAEEITMTLYVVIRSGYMMKPGIQAPYNKIWASHLSGIQTEKRDDQIFLPQSIYNNRRILIPAEHAWDLIHPIRPDILIGSTMAEECLPLHWCNL